MKLFHSIVPPENYGTLETLRPFQWLRRIQKSYLKTKQTNNHLEVFKPRRITSDLLLLHNNIPYSLS
jgi:hypothetical protein